MLTPCSRYRALHTHFACKSLVFCRSANIQQGLFQNAFSQWYHVKFILSYEHPPTHPSIQMCMHMRMHTHLCMHTHLWPIHPCKWNARIRACMHANTHAHTHYAAHSSVELTLQSLHCATDIRYNYKVPNWHCVPLLHASPIKPNTYKTSCSARAICGLATAQLSVSQLAPVEKQQLIVIRNPVHRLRDGRWHTELDVQLLNPWFIHPRHWRLIYLPEYPMMCHCGTQIPLMFCNC